MSRSKKTSSNCDRTSHILQVHTNVYQSRLFKIASLMILWCSWVIPDIDKPSVWDAKIERTCSSLILSSHEFVWSPYFIEVGTSWISSPIVPSYQRISQPNNRVTPAYCRPSEENGDYIVSPQMIIHSTTIDNTWSSLVEHD